MTLFNKKTIKWTYNIYNLNEGNIYYDENWCGPFTQLCEYAYLKDIFIKLEDLFGDSFGDYDYYIYSSNGVYNPPKPIIITNDKTRILFYISDEQSTVPQHLKKYFKIIFKCYLPDNFEHETIYPFPLGYHRDIPHLPIIPINDRCKDVFFSGNLEQESRLAFYKELSPLWFLPDYIFYKIYRKLKKYYPRDCSSAFNNSRIIFSGGFNSGLNGNEYAEILYNSKIALCPPGHTSSETFRHFEAMRAGCVIISLKLPNNRLYHDAPFIILEDWKNLRIKIMELLKNPNMLNDIHLETLNWWEKKCSEVAISNYIHKKIKTII